MQVTKTIICDLTGFRPQTVEVAQNDRNSRRVACRLRANGESWTVPEGVEVLVSYTLPGGTPGLYADPTAVIEGDTVTVSLSEQLLSEPGAAEAAVVLEKDGARLATFPFRVHVIGGNGLTNAETYPILGAEFEGKLLFGGPGGTVVPLSVEELLAAFPTFEIQVVAQLPAEGADKTIYLVPFADDSGSYLEYLYVNGAWEVIGSRSGQNVNANWSQNDPTQPDYVKGRTHWEEGNQTVIEWDGVTEGRPSADIMGDGSIMYYKISDLTPDPNSFVDTSQYLSNGTKIDIGEVDIVDGMFVAGVLCVVTQLNVTDGDMEVTFPSTGIYTPGNLSSDSDIRFAHTTLGSIIIHPIASEYIPDEIARVDDIPDMVKDNLTQSDLAQNDTEQPDYVKNRTHWSEPGEVQLLAPVTLEFGAYVDSKLDRTLSIRDLMFDIKPGETYTVTWNGVSYDVVAGSRRYSYVTDGDTPVTYYVTDYILGNYDMWGEDGDINATGLPFMIYHSVWDTGGIEGFGVLAQGTEAETVTMAVRGPGTVYHPLAEQFIPDSIPRRDDISGATPGQIARIAAVDDNGVPTEWEAVDVPDFGENVTQKESVTTVTVGANPVLLDGTAPEQVVNLAWRVPSVLTVPAFANYYIANDKYTYPHSFDTKNYVQFFSSAFHGNADVYDQTHTYFAAMHYIMDGDSVGKLDYRWGNVFPSSGSNEITGTGWVYGKSITYGVSSPSFMLLNSDTGTGTVDYVYCIDVTALEEAGTITTGMTVAELAELFGELPLVPGEDYPGGTIGDGTATLSINRGGEITTVDNASSTATVRGGDILSVEGGSVTFMLKVVKTVAADEADEWVGIKWVVVGDSLTDGSVNADTKYHKLIAEATGITVVDMGMSNTGYWRTSDAGHAFYQRMVNIPADADIITIFGSVNDWMVVNSNVPYGEASDTLASGTLAGYINEAINVAIAQAPYAQIALVTLTDYAGPPDYVLEDIADTIVKVAKYRKIKCLDLYHESGFRVDDPTFAAAYCTDYPATTDTYGHPNNLAHEKIIAPEFMELLKRMILTV